MRYNFEYSEDSPYSAVRSLLRSIHTEGSVVLDLGCGNAPLADSVIANGAQYVGIDIDIENIEAAVHRGVEVHRVDLDSSEAPTVLNKIVDGRPLAAILALDVLEHLVAPDHLLRQIHDQLANRSTALIVSVPNVTHVDIARKLLSARWDITSTGLLDSTHLRFYTSASVDQLMTQCGWREVDRRDYSFYRSDQYFPALLPSIAEGSLLATYLQHVRETVDNCSHVNQFVRAYLPGSADIPPRSNGHDRDPAPFLSIVMRTLGEKPQSMIESITCLGGQTDPNWELIIVVHGDDRRAAEVRSLIELFHATVRSRIRVKVATGGTRSRPANVGMAAARGEYVAFLDDDDFVTGDWVETFHRGAEDSPGSIVRAWCADRDVEPCASAGASGDAEDAPPRTLSGLRPTFTSDFDLIQHLYENRTPVHCFAIPRCAITEFRLRWNEELAICEDWDFLLRSALWLGVHDTRRVTAVYNRWQHVSSLATTPEWAWNASRDWIRLQIDHRPILMPPGTVGRVEKLYEASLRVAALEREMTELRSELAKASQSAAAQFDAMRARAELAEDAERHLHIRVNELEKSTSWRVTAPLRLIGRLVSALKRNAH